ncbi:alpha/beta hydrolase [Nocardiopsis sp. CNS-639]|uniref:alpha/beta hydrolase n=1 Tax=Nocardiopsis sp. CNS-639 TaxID=1169153 RepID=UPI001E4B13FE|nr:alpha/beta hydrolase [Nocardiopsis sp. CNS-639]
MTLLLAVGTFVWQAPVIGLVGSIGGHVPGWLTVLALLGFLAGVGAWSLHRSKALGIGVVVCAVCAVFGGNVIADQRAALHAEDVSTQAGDFFGPFLSGGKGPDEVVEYGPVDGRSIRMGVYLPVEPGEHAPVVVHVHGGGFTSGDVDSDTALARHLTDRGYVVFTPTYTLATDRTATWDIAPKEIVCALATVNGLADEYGGDPSRLYVTGSSAGGNLAPMAANLATDGQDLGADCGPLPQVTAVAVSIAATDPGFAEGNPYAISGDLSRDLAEAYTGGTPEEVPERYAAVNAANTLTATSPPTLLVYGENDWLVPAQASLSYAQRARALGVDVRVVGVPWTGHLIGLSGAGGRMIAEGTAHWFATHR